MQNNVIFSLFICKKCYEKHAEFINSNFSHHNDVDTDNVCVMCSKLTNIMHSISISECSYARTRDTIWEQLRMHIGSTEMRFQNLLLQIGNIALGAMSDKSKKTNALHEILRMSHPVLHKQAKQKKFNELSQLSMF